MNTEKSQEILKAFGNPVLKTEKGSLVFARQSQNDISEIEKLTDEELINHWKNLVWLNEIYGQVSLNDLQRIELLELEMKGRSNIIRSELEEWYKKAESEFDESIPEVDDYDLKDQGDRD
jgi:hypothetical protein